MKNEKHQPAQSKLTVLRQICNLIPAHLVPRSGAGKLELTINPEVSVLGAMSWRCCIPTSLTRSGSMMSVIIWASIAEDSRLYATPSSRNGLSHANKVRPAAMAQIVREQMGEHHQDEARAFVRALYTTEANLIPDIEAKTPTVELHSLATPKANKILNNLCLELNETQTDYPDTNLKLFFKSVSL